MKGELLKLRLTSEEKKLFVSKFMRSGCSKYTDYLRKIIFFNHDENEKTIENFSILNQQNFEKLSYLIRSLDDKLEKKFRENPQDPNKTLDENIRDFFNSLDKSLIKFYDLLSHRTELLTHICIMIINCFTIFVHDYFLKDNKEFQKNWAKQFAEQKIVALKSTKEKLKSDQD